MDLNRLLIQAVAARGSGGGIPTPPLDNGLSASASAAWGLTKLRGAYAGNCIQVRRSSDDALANIGFTTDNRLDTVALLAHVGAGSGFVRTWYDQSGNARDLTQTTNANQPRIVNSGTVDTVNGVPCIFFDNAANRFLSNGSLTSIVTANTAYSHVSFARALSGSNVAFTYLARALWCDGALNDLWATFYDNGSGTKQFSTGNQNDSNKVTVNITYPQEGVWTGRTGSSTVKATRNGGVEASNATTSTTTGANLFVGQGQGQIATDRMDGYIGVVIFFASTISLSDLNLVGQPLATMFGQVWTTAS